MTTPNLRGRHGESGGCADTSPVLARQLTHRYLAVAVAAAWCSSAPPAQAQQTRPVQPPPQQAQQVQPEQQGQQVQPAQQGQQGQTARQAQQGQQRGQEQRRQPAAAADCSALPAHGRLNEVLRRTVSHGDPSVNGGLGNPVWAVLVDRHGNVCVVTRSGDSPGDQWPGSRAIAASKAYTANAFSLPDFALSSANLYWPTQPGNSLYGTAAGNPVVAAAIYAGDAASWGTADDPLTGRRVGGTIAFGGGLALYTSQGEIVGGLGVSGDESCTDHVLAWKLRHALNLDNVPNGVTGEGNDNIVYDLTTDPGSGQQKSASGYGHPTCSPRARTIAEGFSSTAPVGPEE